MWALVLEAILSGGCDSGLVIDTFFEVIKLGDLASDIMFILTLSQFDSILGGANAAADDEYHIDMFSVLIATIAFTFVGFVFSLVLNPWLLRILKRRPRQENSPGYDIEKGKKKRACWAQVNFWVEDFPQFMILLYFVGAMMLLSDEELPCQTFLDSSSTAPPIEEMCTDEQRDYMSDLERDSLISFLFTSLSSTRALWFCCTAWCNGTCCICCDRDDEQVTSSSSSWEGNTSHNEPVGHFVPSTSSSSWEETTSQPAEAIGHAYSKTIRTETLHADGSKTVTITQICRDEENMYEI
jgi:hypothetical protein